MSKTRSPDRLLALLSEFGYELGNVNPVEGSFTFTRERNNGLYEWISCSFAGKESEAAVCRIGASVTRIVPLKKLTEKVVLVDVASVPDRGWTIVESDEDLIRWEQLVARVAVSKAEEFADKISTELLERTVEARNAVRECVSHLRETALDCGFSELKSQASEEQLRIATRLAEWPGVQQVVDATEEYELACLAVVMCIRPSELPDPSKVNEMPLENERLMWEIQLIADKLLDVKLRKAAAASRGR